MQHVGECVSNIEGDILLMLCARAIGVADTPANRPMRLWRIRPFAVPYALVAHTGTVFLGKFSGKKRNLR